MTGFKSRREDNGIQASVKSFNAMSEWLERTNPFRQRLY